MLCGIVFRPGCSKLTAIIAIVAGCVVLVLGKLMGFSFLVEVFFGVPPILYGLGVFFGVTGKMEILKDASGRSPDSEDDSLNLKG
jgi:hypothetical protein